MAAATAIIGGIGLAAGLGSSIAGGIQSAQAQKRQQKAMEEANAIARQKLAFAQDVYKEWQDIFGPINAQLGNYYANLSADTAIARYKNAGAAALTQLETSLKNTRDNLQKQFARQGMADGGQAAAMNTNLDMQAAEQRAAVHASILDKSLNAGREIAQEKMGFAQLGTAQKGQALALMGDGYNSMQQNYLSQAGMQGQQAQKWDSLAMAGGGMMGSALGALGDLANTRATGSGANAVAQTGLTPNTNTNPLGWGTGFDFQKDKFSITKKGW